MCSFFWAVVRRLGSPEVVEALVEGDLTLLFADGWPWIGGVSWVAGLATIIAELAVALAGLKTAFKSGGAVSDDIAVISGSNRAGFKSCGAVQTLGGWGRSLTFLCTYDDAIGAHIEVTAFVETFLKLIPARQTLLGQIWAIGEQTELGIGRVL